MPRCKNCASEFPNRMFIDNKVRVLNSRKYCLKCSPFGQDGSTTIRLLNMDKLPPKHKICPKCKELRPISAFYIRSGINKRVHSWCKSCFNRGVQERMRRRKTAAIDYAGGKCQICNYNKCEEALEFHHENKDKKSFGISERRQANFEDIKNEINKCILLCANCHRELHAGIIKAPRRS